MIVSTHAFIGLLGVTFAAGLIDSIAGGGGLLMVPALLLAGIPPHLALGTNKLASVFGTGVAAWNYFRKGKVLLPLIAIGIGFTLIGGWAGSRLALSLNSDVMAKVIVFMLPIGMLALFLRKKHTTELTELRQKDKWLKVPAICLTLGLYDGFFGPGVGSFLALSFYMLLNLSLVRSTANSKVFNLASNFGALIGFIIGGKVSFALGLPLATMSIAGNYVGSHLAIKNGDALIKKCLIGVLGLLMLTLILKYLV